jgi:hypothetical protein
LLCPLRKSILVFVRSLKSIGVRIVNNKREH